MINGQTPDDDYSIKHDMDLSATLKHCLLIYKV